MLSSVRIRHTRAVFLGAIIVGVLSYVGVSYRAEALGSAADQQCNKPNLYIEKMPMSYVEANPQSPNFKKHGVIGQPCKDQEGKVDGHCVSLVKCSGDMCGGKPCKKTNPGGGSPPKDDKQDSEKKDPQKNDGEAPKLPSPPSSGGGKPSPQTPPTSANDQKSPKCSFNPSDPTCHTVSEALNADTNNSGDGAHAGILDQLSLLGADASKDETAKDTNTASLEAAPTLEQGIKNWVVSILGAGNVPEVQNNASEQTTAGLSTKFGVSTDVLSQPAPSGFWPAVQGLFSQWFNKK